MGERAFTAEEITNGHILGMEIDPGKKGKSERNKAGEVGLAL